MQTRNSSDMECPIAVVEPIADRTIKKNSVLVADDDHMVRLSVQLGLERSGFDVYLASDGLQAIDLYQENREEIAIVLLDVQMPLLDGPNTLDRLRALGIDVPVCLMSGDTGPYMRDDLVKRGASCIIAKPFLLSDLAKTLRQLTHGSPTASRVPERAVQTCH